MMMQDLEAARADALAQLRAGSIALGEGRLEQAAEALVTAETVFRRLNDLEHAAESRVELAEVQRQNGAEEKAAGSYERAIALFQQVGLTVREASATLALGHVERQRGQLERARDLYARAAELFAQAGNLRGQASAALALGHTEAQLGHPNRAAPYYAEARLLYARVGDRLGEADAARGQGDVFAQLSQQDAAEEAYTHALEIYRDRRDVFGEVDSLVGRARLRADLGRLDEASTLFGEAISLARPIEYELGEADGTLGLADIELHRARWDQALANAVQADERYGAANNAPGKAEVNRVLGEVQLRRGQLSQAITDFNRAGRAFRTLHLHRSYVLAVLGAAEANRRRSIPRKAEDLFSEARTVAIDVEQPALEASAILGLGEIARQRGQSQPAENLLSDARRRFEARSQPAAVAAALVASARLALTRGQLDRAMADVDESLAQSLAAQTNTSTPGPDAAAHVVAASVLLACGHLTAARERFTLATATAERQNDPFSLAEAALGMAETDLQADDLQAAVAGFNRAAELARQIEARAAEGQANVGLGRVLLRRELWEEAATAHQEMLPRFREAEDPVAQALVHLGVGEARRNLDALADARESFEQAARLYASADAALGEAAAAQGEARVLVELSELEAADGRYARAIELTERIGRALSRTEDRHTFFDSRAQLYAEAIMVAARRQNGARVTELATAYAGLADKPGRANASRLLREYESSLPVRGADVTEDVALRNRAAQRLLASARDVLK